MAPRPKKRETPQSSTNTFVDALRFVGAVTKDVGAPFETHVSLGGNWASAFNGVLASGVKIQEDIYACPNNKILIEALSKCGEHISITQLDNGRLSIKSDKFKAVVPCIDPVSIQIGTPDEPIAVIDNRLKSAIEAVGILADPNAQSVAAASILLAGQSTIATNGHIMFEYWHGIDLPHGLALPKAVVPALAKNNKTFSKFGFSSSSATFFFNDDSWLKTQFYAEQWPEVRHILDTKANLWPVPKDFFTALAAVAPFSPDGLVHFDKEVLRSHNVEGVGASYEVSGLPKGPIFNAKQLQLIKPYAETIDFMAKGPNHIHSMLVFYGGSIPIRGMITGRSAQ